MIGLFGFSEVLRNVLKPAVQQSALKAAAEEEARFGTRGWLGSAIRSVFQAALQRAKSSVGRILTSSTIGSFIGMLPGAGADIAAWVSYAVSKRRSTKDEQAEYGNGSLQGIADATTANNASLAGAWIPALVLGIPGDSVTAIVIGVLLMKNVSPGPDIFQNPEQLPIVYSIYLTFVLANLLLLPLGFLAIRLGSQIVRVPRYVILPLILMACIVGSFAINSSYFDVYVMLCMGLLGFVLERFGVPLGPVVLGIILGPRLEETFVQSLTKSDSLTAFFSRPIAAGLGVLCIVVWLWPLISRLIRKNADQPTPSSLNAKWALSESCVVAFLSPNRRSAGICGEFTRRAGLVGTRQGATARRSSPRTGEGEINHQIGVRSVTDSGGDCADIFCDGGERPRWFSESGGSNDRRVAMARGAAVRHDWNCDVLSETLAATCLTPHADSYLEPDRGSRKCRLAKGPEDGGS